jgi:hypothetical protein
MLGLSFLLTPIICMAFAAFVLCGMKLEKWIIRQKSKLMSKYYEYRLRKIDEEYE